MLFRGFFSRKHFTGSLGSGIICLIDIHLTSHNSFYKLLTDKSFSYIHRLCVVGLLIRASRRIKEIVSGSLGSIWIDLAVLTSVS